MEKAHAAANANVLKTLYKKAIEGDNACIIFWCKTRLGMRDVNPQQIDIISSDRSMSPVPAMPVQINNVIDVETLAKTCAKVNWSDDDVEVDAAQNSGRRVS